MTWVTDIRQVTVDSLKLSSMKGVPRIFKPQPPLLQGLWVVSVLTFLCLSAYFFIGVVSDYFERNTTIDFKETSMLAQDQVLSDFPFPSLEVCNLKPVHVKADLSAISLMEYLDQVNQNMTDFLAKNPSQSQAMTSTLYNLYATQAYFEFVGRDKATYYGQRLDDLIVSCQVTSVAQHSLPCEEVTVYEKWISPTYINCYAVVLKHKNLETFAPRSISLVLHLNNADDYIHTGFSPISNDLQAAGAQIRFDSGVKDSNHKSIFVSPGTLTAIDVEMGLRIRLPSPYGDCVTTSWQEFYDAVTGQPLLYNAERCRAACIQRSVSTRCQCLKANSRALFSRKERELAFCASARETFEDRLQSFVCALNETERVADQCLVECPNLCEEVTMKTYVSSVSWPRDSQKIGFYSQEIVGRSFEHQYSEYQELVDQIKKEPVEDILNELNKLNKIERNFLKVQVTLPDPIVNVVRTKVRMTVWDVISSIASLINTFSGITIIVIVEFIDYVVHLVLVFTTKTEKEPNPTNSKADDRRPVGNGIHVYL